MGWGGVNRSGVPKSARVWHILRIGWEDYMKEYTGGRRRRDCGGSSEGGLGFVCVC